QAAQEQKDNAAAQQQNNEKAAQEQKDNAAAQQQNNEKAAQEQKDNAAAQQQNNEKTARKSENVKSQSTRSSQPNVPNMPGTASRDLISDNVRSNGGGGADVTPGCAKIQKDGTVKYDYTVSVNPVKSSDHGQTGSTFGITVPKFAKNVKFELIGTREKDSKKPHDVNLDLGQISEAEYKKNSKQFHNIPTYEEYQKLKKEGKTELPASVVAYDESDNTFSGGTYNPDLAKSYGINTLVDGPVGIRVTFDISEDQFKKTPYVPLDARLRWKSFWESESIHSYEDGSQSLDDFRPHSDTGFNNEEKSKDSSYTYVEHPEKIKKGTFDENGLYLEPSVGVTKKTGDWSVIGNDMTKSPFNYVDQFTLHANRAVTYYAPSSEDLADIAVTTECQDDCGCPVDPENPDKPGNPDKP
ncbi:cell envelope integrity protein TolA, partial [Staphylococcus epidermidis]|nr:cell envelope integrity protein TolA [Staphylococcus epidermidis]